MKTLIIKIEKESSLAHLLNLVKKLKLKARVLNEKGILAREIKELHKVSGKGLASAYGNDEPDYEKMLVKEPNPEYKKWKKAK